MCSAIAAPDVYWEVASRQSLLTVFLSVPESLKWMSSLSHSSSGCSSVFFFKFSFFPSLSLSLTADRSQIKKKW